MADSDGDSQWFTYLLNPAKLTTDLAANPTVEELKPLLKDLLTNLLNNQHGFFTDNPQELWFARTAERKCLVLRNLSLQVAAYLSWRLATLETVLPPPLLLYLLTALVQAQPDQTPPGQLANTANHTELDLQQLASPGPTLQALTLLHRWVVRTFMAIRTPARQERSSTVMVPGVRRDPAILYRDQTHTLVSAVAPTSIKFLALVVEASIHPVASPSHLSFPTNGAALDTDSSYAVAAWQQDSLLQADGALFLATAAYDLGCCYFFCEDYTRARACFASHFAWRKGEDTTLGGEVHPGKLAGYCACLGLDPAPSSTPLPAPTLPAKLTAPPPALITTLAEDTVERRSKGDTSGRECAELALASKKNGRQGGELLAKVTLLNLVSRSLQGLPICLRTKRLLTKLPSSALLLLEQQVEQLLKAATPREQRLLRCLVLDLMAADIVSKDSKVAALVGLDTIGPLSVSVKKLTPCPTPSFLLLPASSDRLATLNSSLELLSCTDPAKVASLVAQLGPRQARKLSGKWVVEELGWAGQVPDLVHVLVAKAGQLKKLGGCWRQARALLGAALGEVKMGGGKDRGLGAQLEGELLELEQLAMEEGEKGEEDVGLRTAACLLGEGAALPSPSLATSCVLTLLNSGDWEGVGKLSHTNMPYIVAARGSPHSTVFLLVRHLGFLMLNLRSNSHQLVKKFGRDVWDSMAHLVSTAASKRNKDGQANIVTRERALVSSLLCRVTNPSLLQLLLSLLATLHNVARDDPVTDILSIHASVWPTGLATNAGLQERLVEELLSSLLSAALTSQPTDPTVLRMLGDLQFAAGRHTGALKHYLEAVTVRTDFFQLDCGPPAWLLEEAVVGRMMTCCRELGRLMQAVVLSQFIQEPNYAQAFKFLEDQTEDGGESLYGCIWDMAILEFAMSLHTKRGEAARRRAAKHCIWQLELNTNNDEEILKEAANVRKAMFLRSLATQFF